MNKGHEVASIKSIYDSVNGEDSANGAEPLNTERSLEMNILNGTKLKELEEANSNLQQEVIINDES